MSKKLLIGLIVIGSFAYHPLRAQDSYIGEIRMFAGNYAPKGWALCNGQLLSISQYSPLYAVLGTIYGGNGQTTFALPDLRGRVPLGPGQGPGLSAYNIGIRGGYERNTIINSEMPAHAHPLPTVSFNPNDPKTITAGNASVVTSGNKPTSTFNSGITGASQPETNMQPYLGINFIISLTGTFPSRE